MRELNSVVIEGLVLKANLLEHERMELLLQNEQSDYTVLIALRSALEEWVVEALTAKTKLHIYAVGVLCNGYIEVEYLELARKAGRSKE